MTDDPITSRPPDRWHALLLVTGLRLEDDAYLHPPDPERPLYASLPMPALWHPWTPDEFARRGEPDVTVGTVDTMWAQPVPRREGMVEVHAAGTLAAPEVDAGWARWLAERWDAQYRHGEHLKLAPTLDEVTTPNDRWSDPLEFLTWRVRNVTVQPPPPGGWSASRTQSGHLELIGATDARPWPPGPPERVPVLRVGDAPRTVATT